MFEGIVPLALHQCSGPLHDPFRRGHESRYESHTVAVMGASGVEQ